MIRISIMSHHGLRNSLTKDGMPAFLRAVELIPTRTSRWSLSYMRLMEKELF